MTDGTIIKGIYPSRSLNWVGRPPQLRRIYPPAVCSLGNEMFQISGFEHETNEFYVIDVKSLSEAINLSVSIYGAESLTLPELAAITVICDRMDIDLADIEAFALRGIKGRQSFEILRAVNRFCPVLKRYLCKKDVPLKTLAVFDKLKDDCRRYVKNTVEDKEISVGDFRKLVNLLFDMQQQADSADLQGDAIKNLTAKQDATRISFMKQFHAFTDKLPVSVQSEDNFETGILVFSFSAESAEEYEKILKASLEKLETVKDIFRFFDEQNIS